MKGFPGMEAYQRYCKKDVMERGYIQMDNITGAKAFAGDWEDYKYYKKRKADLGKKSVNYRIQHRGACCFKLASMMFFNWIVKNNLLGKVKLCIPAHDEWNVEAPDNIADKVAKVLLKAMEKGAKPFCTELPLPGDLSLNKEGKLPTYWIH